MTQDDRPAFSFSDRIRWTPHNLIAHPMMLVLPCSWGEWLHDATVPKPTATPGEAQDDRRSEASYRTTATPTTPTP